MGLFDVIKGGGERGDPEMPLVRVDSAFDLK